MQCTNESGEVRRVTTENFSFDVVDSNEMAIQWLINRCALKIESFVDQRFDHCLFLSESEHDAMAAVVKDKYLKVHQYSKLKEAQDMARKNRSLQARVTV